MNITIFGASGTIGKMVTKLALDNGDHVTAYVRRKDSLEPHKNLEIIVGDLTNIDLIEKSIKDSEVIISTLGPAMDMSRKLKEHSIANGHEIIIKSMKKLNKLRLITLGTPSIHSDDDRKNLSTILVPIMGKLLFPNAFMEMKKIENLIKYSNLDWTVVRMINPNVKHNNSEYDISIGDKPSKMAVSRENVASFIYKVATEKLYIHKMPIIFNK